MNSDYDITDFIDKTTSITHEYLDKIDCDNLIAVFVMLSKTLAEKSGLKNKDLKRRLKDIIDIT